MSESVKESVRFWGYTLGTLALVLAAGISIGATYARVASLEEHIERMQEGWEVQYELLLRIDERQRHITVYLEEIRQDIRRREE